ncbi:MAG: GNAT family N-acetyltransferase [Ilumatobacteraceae bacterium]
MPGFLIAQINIGIMVAPTDDPAVAEFMENLDRINAQADAAPGFVWRLQSESGNATDIQIFADPLELVNMSVWESVQTLKDYVYRTDHVDFFRRRAEWFEADAKRVALWTIDAAATPDLTDAVRRVEFLDRHGPSPYAFGFAKPPAPLVFETTDPSDPDTLRLIDRLDRELTRIATHPGENHFTLSASQVTGDQGRMLRARYDGRLVGCGAVRRIAPSIGEIKRMFVDPSVRGLKIGAAILDQIEQAAVSLHITELKLETGPNQPAALGLYVEAGFERCGPWGEYLDSPATSMCFSKRLPQP